MPTPSLLIVPARFKTGKLYSQIPTSGAGDFTVTRNTEARRFDSAGLVASVASGIPRLDYFTSGGVTGCPALLVEPSGTNLVSQSTFSTGWGTSLGGSVSGNASGTNSPEGSGNAALLNVSTTPFSSIFRNIATVSGSVYTASVFAKKRDKNFLYFVNIAGSTSVAWFNLASGTVGTVGANTTARIENYGNGWYRCSITQTASGSTSYIQFGLSDADNTNAAASSGSNFVFGAQVELGSVPTSYIPTTTAAVTRNADVISVSGAVSGSIGQTEGTIYAEVDVRTFASSAARRIVNLRVDGSNLLSLEINTASTNIEFVATSGGVSVNAVASGLTAGITKIAVGYNSVASGTVLYVNGTLRDTKTIAIPNLSAAVFGLGVRGDGGAGTQLNDRIRAVALYNTRLLDAELATLTTL